MITRTLKLTRGLVALIDDCDFDEVSRWKWNASESESGRFYARRMEKNNETGGKKIIYLHRFLLNAEENIYVDHINRNTLDNRRNNLRLATPSLNLVNRVDYRPKSGFRGVYKTSGWNKNPWSAKISINSKAVHLGSYCELEDAARAYDMAAKKAFGDFATLNFPDKK